MMTTKKKNKNIEVPHEELVLEAQLKFANGSHPIFHDLERQEALRKTQALARTNPDLAMLHGLLEDAHARLEESSGYSDEVTELRESVDSLTEEAKQAEEDLRAAEKERDELKQVEPIAAAFATCWKAGLLRKGGLKLFTHEQRVVVVQALALLGVREQDIN